GARGSPAAQPRGLPRAGAAGRRETRVHRGRHHRDGWGELPPQAHPNARAGRPLQSIARETMRGRAERPAGGGRRARHLHVPRRHRCLREPHFEDA
ncbi:MAG: hypothetical protein AVDCRST_MAG88-1447, partial [uncultured Thermomicrobiales bacterium]